MLELLFTAGLLSALPAALWVARGHAEMMRLDGRAPSQGWEDAHA